MDFTKRVGRTVKVNRKTLTPKEGKDYAEVVFFGDLHYGHPTCLVEKAQAMLDYCLEHKIPVLLMGDLLECGITGAVGDSVYAQHLNPQEQMEEVIKLLTPLAKAGLILGSHSGNHEERIFKTTGINIGKIIAGVLNVSYLHTACWNLFNVGGRTYAVYSLHGSSGSRFIYTKLKSVTDISHYFLADVVAMGHVHDIATVAVERQKINLNTRKLSYWKQYVLLTGHYLGYALSYAQTKGMPPSKVGSPKIKFSVSERDIHISF